MLNPDASDEGGESVSVGSDGAGDGAISKRNEAGMLLSITPKKKMNSAFILKRAGVGGVGFAALEALVGGRKCFVHHDLRRDRGCALGCDVPAPDGVLVR